MLPFFSFRYIAMHMIISILKSQHEFVTVVSISKLEKHVEFIIIANVSQ